jgi:hypothetical protein|nr:hypothetical protein [uncultured Prevotella sp.]
MDRNEAKEFHPIMQAFAEGKVIECRNKPDSIKGLGLPNDWTNVKDLFFMRDLEYRIKSEFKYRPFANAEECWQEMLKHQPFGWVKEKERNVRTEINYIHNDGVMFSCGSVLFERLFDVYTFVDGNPFGIKVEE